MKKWICAFAVLAALVAVACSDIDPNDGQDDSEVAGSVQAMHSTVEQYYSYRQDMRKCMWPMCGGYFIKAVNKWKTRCADGQYLSECYVAQLKNGSELDEYEWSDILGAPGLLKGRQVPAQDGAMTWVTLNVTEVWRAADDEAPTGTFYGVHDTGINCFAAPCFTLLETKLNSHGTAMLSGLRGRLGDKAVSAVQEADIIAAGQNVNTRFHWRRGRELDVNQLYIKQLHSADLYCATANFIDESGTAFFYAKNFKVYDLAKEWLSRLSNNTPATLEIHDGTCADQPKCRVMQWAPQCGTVKDGEPMTYMAPCYFHDAVMNDAGTDQESKGFYTPGECEPACSLDDPSKNYVGTSPQQCMLIKFRCDEGQAFFSDDCGCGCEVSGAKDSSI